MKKYKVLQAHYENCLIEHGPNFKGMDWPNIDDLNIRFGVLTKILPENRIEEIKLLDLGCGIGLLIDYLIDNNLFHNLNYCGIDISNQMIQTAKNIHPSYDFETRDILEVELPDNSVDFTIMNGLFTEKRELNHDEMVVFFHKMIVKVFNATKKGIAFNVMSSHVDWKRNDLFHLDLDELISFLVKNCSRKIQINMDYGLYEYSVFVRK